MRSFHGSVGLRGLNSTTVSNKQSGRFGRMLEYLAPSATPTADLLALGQFMVKPFDPAEVKSLGDVDDDENPRIPAGYTYLGQFIDHDVTFDTVTVLDRIKDPEGVVDFRTPRFDLDSLYGRGPSDQPYLYQADGLSLVEGEPITFQNAPRGDGQHDLPRNRDGVAIIGDPRNDENMIIAQFHATIIHFHNKRVRDLRPQWEPLRPELRFAFISNDVRWHYQYIVLNDFLKRIIGDELVEKLVSPVFSGSSPALQFYDPGKGEYPFMPVEFAVAAYRFGHSAVRPSYHLNDHHPGFEPLPGGGSSGRINIFTSQLTSQSPRDDLRGFEPIANGAFPRSNWGIEWKYFFEVGGRLSDAGGPINNLKNSGADVRGPVHGYKIDTELVNPLRELPSDPPPELAAITGGVPRNSLAQRNLLRGRSQKLPSGQTVAVALGQNKLTAQQNPQVEGVQSNLDEDSPLWYYILKEAEVLCGGHHLGPVGARIVGETFVGLLWHDKRSFLRHQPSWRPTAGAVAGEEYGLQYLIAYALDLADPRPRVTPPLP